MSPTSLRDLILNASTVEEIEKLMNLGSVFNSASRNTRHKWELAAKARAAFLLAAHATRATQHA